ncbi:MAG: outer membrane beta-barrel domain-containing protein [Bdellovibrionales bacterium]|nr:outer membrane beta-barrel domain-containing protein [Bdellovibrionales bacterium]
MLVRRLMLLAGASVSTLAWSQTKVVAPAPSAPVVAADEEAGEDVAVDAIKKKYWATGDESQMGVVQNRVYSKAHKFQFGLMGGIAFADPFLSLKPYGFNAGYHFSEYLGVNVLGWKIASSGSSALNTLMDSGKKANTVLPSSFYGAEATGSFLYGKLSLMGYSIIYYDMYVSGGMGMTNNENGNEFTQMVGLGQRFYINRWLSLKFDYRFMHNKETVKEKEITADLGKVVGQRDNFAHTITLGLDALFGFWN